MQIRLKEGTDKKSKKLSREGFQGNFPEEKTTAAAQKEEQPWLRLEKRDYSTEDRWRKKRKESQEKPRGGNGGGGGTSDGRPFQERRAKQLT